MAKKDVTVSDEHWSRIPFRTKFDPSEDPGIVFPKESLTQQQFKEETDINNIVARAQQTGILPQYASDGGIYGDFSDPIDFLEAQNLVIKAREQFEALPAKIRDYFQNDPARLMEFINDPANTDEAVRLGLAVRKEEPPAKPAVKKKEASVSVASVEKPEKRKPGRPPRQAELPVDDE